MEIPVAVRMPFERFDPVGRTVDRRFGDKLHQFRQCPAVIGLGMVGDDKINLRRIDLF